MKLSARQRAKQKRDWEKAKLGLTIAGAVLGVALLAMTGVGAVAAGAAAAGGGATLFGTLFAAGVGASAAAGSTAGIALAATAGVAAVTTSSVTLATTPKNQMSKTQMAMEILNIATGGLSVVGGLASAGIGIAQSIQTARALATTAQIAGYAEMGAGVAQSSATLAQGIQSNNESEIAMGALGIGMAGIGVMSANARRNAEFVPYRDGDDTPAMPPNWNPNRRPHGYYIKNKSTEYHPNQYQSLYEDVFTNKYAKYMSPMSSETRYGGRKLIQSVTGIYNIAPQISKLNVFISRQPF